MQQGAGGRPQEGGTRLRTVCYGEGSLVEDAPHSLERALSCIGRHPVTWVDVRGYLRPEEAQVLVGRHGLHPAIVHDVAEHGPGRPKMLDFDEAMFISLKLLRFGESDGSVEERQLRIILGKGFLITVTVGELPPSDLEENLRNPRSRMRKMGADYLLYSILDSVVDSYYSASEELGDRIEDLQDRVISERAEDAPEEVQRLRRSLAKFRRAVWPFREAMNLMAKGEADLIGDGTSPYFREVYGHTVELMDIIDVSRDMLSEIIDIHQTNVSNRLNQVVKVLTVISVFFAPLTFIVGFYGMNFRYLPGSEHPWGYVAVIAAMVLIGVAMFGIFKRRRWF